MSKTRDNHYVPEWYQRGCLNDPKNGKVRYLDLDPRILHLPDGTTKKVEELRWKPPSNCFVQKDLYTTFFGPIVNDEIERYLFGNIDTKGSDAVRAYVEGGIENYHKHFQNFFSYIDVQKIRTPKGLAWIKKHYPSLDQLKLMLEMQAIQNLHCTIWTEGVREIVSAKNSAVKFLITDHPVTVYNRSFPPDSDQCKYPNDPLISLKGTQTIYVLDKDNCLIMTNYEYAQNPSKESAEEKRTNAKNFRNSMARTDAIIRTRELSDLEVSEINYILKNRAKKFVGAAVEDWLFPERTVKKGWNSVGNILLPPKNEQWQFGGEMYVGYEGGGSAYQDAFGRTQPENVYLKKPIADPKTDEPCGCGSPKTYKECCLSKPLNLRPSWSHLSIRERNIGFANAIVDILELNKGKTWTDVRKNLSNDQVKEIYQVLGTLWPRDTDLISLLPKPDGDLRAVYTGIIDPDSTPFLVTSLVPYFSEIIVQNPFLNPWSVRDEFSPIKSPHKFKAQLLKDVSLFLELMPFIARGQINFIPDICAFDSHLQIQMMKLAEDRVGKAKLSGKDAAKMKRLAQADFKRNLGSLPKRVLRKQYKKALPELTESQIEATLNYSKKLLEADRFALLQDNVLDGKDGQFLAGNMTPNFEIAMYLAQATGAILITDSEFRFNEMKAAQSLTMGVPHSDFNKLISLMEFQNFHLCMDLDESKKNNDSSEFKDIQNFFRNMVASSQEPSSARQNSPALMKEFTEAKAKTDAKLSKQFSTQTNIECLMPNGGFVHNNVQRLLLMTGVQNYSKSVPLAVFVNVDLVEDETDPSDSNVI